MPWDKSDAKRHTKKAGSGVLAGLWAKVANDAWVRSRSDASAVKQANAVVKRQAKARSRGS